MTKWTPAEQQVGSTGLGFEHLEYGTLNDLSDFTARNSGDPRRGNARSFLQAALNGHFRRDSLRGIGEFYGIVVNNRETNYGRYNKKDTLLVNMGDTNVGANNKNAYYIYKVYIPEIEPRPFPKDVDDPILYTYADMIASSRIDKSGALPVGAVVKVRYTSPWALLNPVIVDNEGSIFLTFQGVADDRLKKLWKESPSIILSGTPNGERVIKELAELEPDPIVVRYSIIALGDLTKSMADATLAFFQYISTKEEKLDPDERLIPRFKAIVTGVSAFHKAKNKTSKHNTGRALDIRIRAQAKKGTDYTSEMYQAQKLPGYGGTMLKNENESSGLHGGATKGEFKRIFLEDKWVKRFNTYARDFRKGPGKKWQFQHIDEFNYPSRNATGAHMHIHVKVDPD